MKTHLHNFLIFLACFIAISLILFAFPCCNNSPKSIAQNESQTEGTHPDNAGESGGGQLAKRSILGDPFAHFEALSFNALTDSCPGCPPGDLGDQPFIIHLPPDYKTDVALATLVMANFQHTCDVMNGTADTNVTMFPYCHYWAGVNRWDAWVWISKWRNIPNEHNDTLAKWMDKILVAHFLANDYDTSKIKYMVSTRLADIKRACATKVCK